MSIAEFSIQNRLMMILVIIGSLASGWFAFNNMARFEDPEFTIRTAVVITQYPGATPLEVAAEVTEPLETALQQMQEVEELRSASSAGLSIIYVDIKYEFSPSKADLQGIWNKVRNKVRDAERQLPPGAQKPRVNDDFGDVYGLYYLITGEGFSAKQLETYAKSLQDDLLSVEGVAKVALSGVQREGIYVEISKDKSAALGVSINRVFNDLAEQNSVVAAGDVKVGNRRLVIQPSGAVDSVTAIEDLVVASAGSGDLVYLKDIATIRREYVDPPELQVRYNGQPAIGLGISNVLGANVVDMGADIDAKIAATLDQRPIGIELHEFYHQGKIVESAVADFAINVIAALVIVLVTLLLFMGLQSALIIGGVLILIIAATLATMYVVDIPMHRISLGALIIALGMLVDNAIVVTEGILVGTQAGRSKKEVAIDIVRRTKWPLLGGTLVGIIAFAPIGFAPGSTAEYTGHLFWVILISLLYSWVFAISLVPFLADLLFKDQPVREQAKPDGGLMVAYRQLMISVLRARWLPIGCVIGLFALAVWGFGFVKAGFFPASTTPQLVVDYWLPQGTDISQTREDMLSLESWIETLEGVDSVQTLIGGGTLRYMLVYSGEDSNSAYGQFLIRTCEFDAIGKLIPEIQRYIDDQYPDAQAKVWQFQLGPGGGSKIEAEFTGPDPSVLRQLAEQAKAIYAATPGAVAIKDSWRQPVSVLVPEYSATRGRRLGISREDLANALLTNFSGRNIGVYREGDNLIPIVARAPAGERLQVEQIAGIQITSPATGAVVPLIEVVDGIQTQLRDGLIRRRDRQWMIEAQTDPANGILAAELFEQVRPQIEAIPLPPGYALSWGGEYGDSAEANDNLAKTFPLGGLAMVLVVVVLFNAVRQPLLIFLVVPLALIGVVLGLLVTGTALEFMAILGLLSLSGLLIKNAIVLVDQMDLEIKEGKPRFDAIVDSAASRLRPVMMGSLTTILGVIPLLGDAFFQSMAVVLVFGLTFATLLTLVLVPALYALLFSVSETETALLQ